MAGVMKRKQRGRPPAGSRERGNSARLQQPDRHKGTRVQSWAPTPETIEWGKAARREGMTMSAWVRRAANRELVREREAVERERERERIELLREVLR